MLNPEDSRTSESTQVLQLGSGARRQLLKAFMDEIIQHLRDAAWMNKKYQEWQQMGGHRSRFKYFQEYIATFFPLSKNEKETNGQPAA